MSIKCKLFGHKNVAVYRSMNTYLTEYTDTKRIEYWSVDFYGCTVCGERTAKTNCKAKHDGIKFIMDYWIDNGEIPTTLRQSDTKGRDYKSETKKPQKETVIVSDEKINKLLLRGLVTDSVPEAVNCFNAARKRYKNHVHQ